MVERRIALLANTIPVTNRPSSVTTASTPPASAVSIHWLSMIWYCGASQVPVPRPSHGVWVK